MELVNKYIKGNKKLTDKQATSIYLLIVVKEFFQEKDFNLSYLVNDLLEKYIEKEFKNDFEKFKNKYIGE